MAPRDESQLHDHVQNAPKSLKDDIPIVDLSGLDGPERSAICEKMAEACKTWGFFQLIGHGLDRSMMEKTKEVSAQFFHGPEEEKMKFPFVPQFGGWGHPKLRDRDHSLVKDDTAEYTYYIIDPPQQQCIDRLPQYPADYKATVLQYGKEAALLARKLCGLLSEQLGLESHDLYGALLNGTGKDMLNASMRTNFYGLDKEGKTLPVTCHAHSDPAGMGILLADEAPGLEVKKDGEWVKVQPIPGSLIVNIGDQLEVASNGSTRVLSTRECHLLMEENG
jgi:isopenicillin N synthase-like dioxygenase